MDYFKIYEQLVARSFSRTLEGYTEKHHIIPRCMGGSDDEYNMAVLTPEEHYLAHLLLVKIYKGTVYQTKLTYAANMMGSTRKGNKVYGWLKRRYSQNTSGENNTKSGIPRTDEVRKKISSSRKGQKRSAETIAKHRATCAAKRALKPLKQPKPKREPKPNTPINRKVDQYTLDGEYLQTFDSATEAAQQLGINRTSITKCCTGKRDTAGGYKWDHTIYRTSL